MSASFSEIKHCLDSLEEQFRANPPALVSTLLLQEKQISSKGTRITTLFLRTLAISSISPCINRVFEGLQRIKFVLRKVIVRNQMIFSH